MKTNFTYRDILTNDYGSSLDFFGVALIFLAQAYKRLLCVCSLFYASIYLRCSHFINEAGSQSKQVVADSKCTLTRCLLC